MPGMSFICELNGELRQKKSRILSSLTSILHTEQYKHEILFYENSYFLGCTRYETYPITYFESDVFSIYLEGKIYGKAYSVLHTELNDLARRISHNGKYVKEQVAQWLLGTDGDFVVFIFQKSSSEIFIINDALGRLPLYYYQTDRKLLVSRELRFVSDLVHDRRFDRMAVAQYLLFGYPLGRRTLLEDIFRLAPASLIRINLESSETNIDRVHQFNFEKKEHKGVTLEENADNLVRLFCEGCKSRTDAMDKNVVSLSGGLDSRAVAAGLHKKNTPFCGATFLDFNKTADADVKIAEQLANVFNVDWKVFQLGPPTGEEILELLKIKSGLSYFGTSFILPFFRRIRGTYGCRMIYFTGDGGDKVLPDLRPSPRPPNLDALIHYIINRNHLFSLDDTAALTKMDKREIISELKRHLMTYPEKDLRQKYVHFLIYERGFKWLFEGEDRNRFYFWSVAPFYAIQFFHYAMHCPDPMKTRYRLYGRFLLKLSSRASAVDNANWKLPITSNKYKWRLFASDIYSKLPSNFRRRVKSKLGRAIKGYESHSNSMNCFLEQIENCQSISNYLSITEIKKMMNDISRKKFDNLFTITSAIEKFECEGSTLEKYCKSDFT